MRTVKGVKIPTREKTSLEFRTKWSKIIDSYSLGQCQKLKDQIMIKDKRPTMTNPFSVEERYLLVLLNRKLESPIKKTSLSMELKK